MKILVTGSRDWTGVEPIRKVLERLPARTIVVHGGARGADSIADQVARELGFEVRCYPINPRAWEELGKRAGPLRNSYMLASEHPDKNGIHIDQAFAFAEDFAKARGTRDMVLKARAVGLNVEVFSV